MPRCNTCQRCSLPKKVPPLKQLLLGASHEGQLRILPPSTSANRSNGFVHIDKLESSPSISSILDTIPEELLNDILTYALEPECNGSWGTELYRTSLRLLKVSTRFHRIVHSLMYRSINLSMHSLARPCTVIRLFHRTITGNPALGPMVKSFGARVQWNCTPFSESEFRIGMEILGLLPNLESFEICGGFEVPSTWPMIHNAIKHWPRIKHIGLFRDDFTLLMDPVYQLVAATPTLSTLVLGGVHSSKVHPLVWVPPPTQNLERKSNITSLTVNDFGERPEALQSLLKLPRALEHFTFGRLYSSPVSWTLNMFQWILDGHQNTLKSIAIYNLGPEHTAINFLEFSKLETLHLSYWGFRQAPEVAAATILAPILHTFIWDFTLVDYHNEMWQDFGQEQKDWLLKFAELAAASKSALRKIEIRFKPDTNGGPSTREQLIACVTPWDLMGEVRDTIKPLGIELEYIEHFSRAEWLRIFELQEQSDSEESDQESSVNSFHGSELGDSEWLA